VFGANQVELVETGVVTAVVHRRMTGA
jgi:hypothetical protein